MVPRVSRVGSGGLTIIEGATAGFGHEVGGVRVGTSGHSLSQEFSISWLRGSSVWQRWALVCRCVRGRGGF